MKQVHGFRGLKFAAIGAAALVMATGHAKADCVGDGACQGANSLVVHDQRQTLAPTGGAGGNGSAKLADTVNVGVTGNGAGAGDTRVTALSWAPNINPGQSIVHPGALSPALVARYPQLLCMTVGNGIAFAAFSAHGIKIDRDCLNVLGIPYQIDGTGNFFNAANVAPLPKTVITSPVVSAY